MNEIMLVRKDELYHYGVKGMKWGVRRYPKYDGPHRGMKKRRAKQAQKVLTQLNEMKSDTKRMSRMSSDQKQSYKNAQKYWTEVEKTGKYRGNTTKRNAIKRYYDAERSQSVQERVTKKAITSATLNVGAAFAIKQMNKKLDTDLKVDWAKAGRDFVKSTAQDIVVSEITNKVFGHF